MSLKTIYLGFELDNPLVPSASPLSRDMDMVKKLGRCRCAGCCYVFIV